MIRLAIQSWRMCSSAVAVAVACAGPACADDDRHPERPVYQRRAFERHHEFSGHGRPHARHSFRAPFAVSPSVSSGWFQRPYPYHLDYYKMRYGGSYAPYFGNLYGPPQVVTAPPYYGPYYGGGYDAGTVNSYGPAPGAPAPQWSSPTDEGDSLPAP